ncbi:hypothetical protein BT96DRAFT_796016, partial [Gymnopus androsaceus JB14]
QLLKDGEKDLGDFSAEISRLQSRILFLERKRGRLEARLKEYASLISPIRRLPDDILSVLFEQYCIDSEQQFPTLGPFKLSAVCSHWRSIVLSNPSIWSRITFRFYK